MSCPSNTPLKVWRLGRYGGPREALTGEGVGGHLKSPLIITPLREHLQTNPCFFVVPKPHVNAAMVAFSENGSHSLVRRGRDLDIKEQVFRRIWLPELY